MDTTELEMLMQKNSMTSTVECKTPFIYNIKASHLHSGRYIRTAFEHVQVDEHDTVEENIEESDDESDASEGDDTSSEMSSFLYDSSSSDDDDNMNIS